MNQELLTFQALLGLMSGIGISLIAVLTTGLIQRINDRLKRERNVLFQVYMKLMELQGHYFSYMVADVHSEAAPSDVRHKVRDLSWQIADLSRMIGSHSILPRLLSALFDDDARSASDRNKELTAIIHELGKSINPKYDKQMAIIGERNSKRREQGILPDRRTPGAVL